MKLKKNEVAAVLRAIYRAAFGVDADYESLKYPGRWPALARAAIRALDKERARRGRKKCPTR